MHAVLRGNARAVPDESDEAVGDGKSDAGGNSAAFAAFQNEVLCASQVKARVAYFRVVGKFDI
jgi:hypothetical protein